MSAGLYAQNVIEITVKGISNQQNDGAQQDRLEAIVDAKKQACEKAGIRIESKTTVENFKVIQDLVESQAATVLLPGFQLIDVGYVLDGTYQVVLSGKIKILEEEENISNKEMRYAKSLNDREKYGECRDILSKYIDSEDKNVAAELKEESYYYYIKWGYSYDIDEDVHKFTAYYPDSKYVSNLESFAAFAVKPVVVYNQTYKSGVKQWQQIELVHDQITFTDKINCAADTIVFKNFRGQDQTLLVNFTLLSDQKSEPTTGFRLVIAYYNGNIRQAHTADQVKIMVDELQTFNSGGSTTFSSSYSGEGFGDYKFSGIDIDGDIPVGKGPFAQKLQFGIYQRSF
jgi:hypothetical protein